MVAFAEPTDVETAYEGSLPAGDRVQYLLNTVSARLRLLMPDLVARMSGNSDLALTVKDVVVQAAIRRLPGNQTQVQSTTQTAGPWSTTTRYTEDSSGTFTDDDLELLRARPVGAGVGVGSIRTGRPDWSRQ